MVYDNFKEFSIIYSIAIIEAVDIILSYEINSLKSIILFGSCARLNIHSGSDVDLLILTKIQINNQSISCGIKSDLECLSNNLSADIIFSTEEFFENDTNLRIYEKIKKEGIHLWKEGVFTDVYKQLLYNSKKRLPVFKGY